jgi:hypothetical protein
VSLLARARTWFFSAGVPPERLASLRILVFAFGIIYLLVRAPHLTDFSGMSKPGFAPVGVVAVLDAPLAAAWVSVIFGLTLLLGVAALLGVYYHLTAPLYALGLLWVLSYRNSWGMIFHTENLLVLHSCILSLSPAADVWAKTRRLSDVPERQAAGVYSWATHALSLVTILSYVLAGIAKLRISGFDWISGEALRTQIAFDALRKIELGSRHAPLGVWLVQHPLLFTPFACLTLAFELGAPLALLGGWVARVWCTVVWGFHLAVVLLMLIVFPYALSGVALASFFPCEQLLLGMVQWVRRKLSGVNTNAQPGAPDAP